ncbi:amino acid ABC transporter permease [Thermoflexus sp.]|uniref:amino acid ABC transporter permease n=1 Tax=Thermoflexus sp. TaxID=1969742 RepID=UPI0025D4CD67|nr:amino acid ABC transporter permease [Thermoflexus sp.]MCS7350803.1 amino acid ABC transporter permease [Thermoflexus sp.]MDW8180254.1 amino acid ABC transporter permease [Anaerolineae bacterium]
MAVSVETRTVSPSVPPPRRVGLDWRTWPWWAVLLGMFGFWIVVAILYSPDYQATVRFLLRGIPITLQLTVIAYSIALILGLIAGLGRVSRNVIFYNLSTLYVEFIRGVPLLVVLFYVAFVAAPPMGDALIGAGQAWGIPPLVQLGRLIRSEMGRAVTGLAIGYGAYLAEVYRAGIESIPKGQMEAARSLGMTYWQAMRFVILPQAIRNVLPPLGNDFIAMLKDTALASAIAVPELMYVGRQRAAGTFRYFEVYNTVALLYLVMTLLLSLLVRALERRTAVPR